MQAIVFYIRLHTAYLWNLITFLRDDSYNILVQENSRKETRRAYKINISAKNGPLGSQASNEKNAGCELWVTFEGCFFMFSWTNISFLIFFYMVGSALTSCLKQKCFFFQFCKYFFFFFWGPPPLFWLKIVFLAFSCFGDCPLLLPFVSLCWYIY